MEGVTLIETAVLQSLITEVQSLRDVVLSTIAEVKDTRKPYLTAQDVQDMTGFGKTWVNQNKEAIGFTTIGGCLRFKRKDVEAYIEANYYKVKTRKPYSRS